MIDLTKRGLPHSVNVGGSLFDIDTDFRTWIKFFKLANEKCMLSDLEFVFTGKIPLLDFSKELTDFFINPNATPKLDGGGEMTLDYILDGEFIYSSFMAEYGIDLVDIEYLHWHKFKALLMGLSEDSLMKRIMGYRGYKKSNKTEEQFRNELKKIWALPKNEDDAEAGILKEIAEEFYNS